STSALHMSAFGDKADMALCGNSLLRSLLGESGHGLVRCTCPLMTQSGHPEGIYGRLRLSPLGLAGPCRYYPTLTVFLDYWRALAGTRLRITWHPSLIPVTTQSLPPTSMASSQVGTGAQSGSTA